MLDVAPVRHIRIRIRICMCICMCIRICIRIFGGVEGIRTGFRLVCIKHKFFFVVAAARRAIPASFRYISFSSSSPAPAFSPSLPWPPPLLLPPPPLPRLLLQRDKLLLQHGEIRRRRCRCLITVTAAAAAAVAHARKEGRCGRRGRGHRVRRDCRPPAGRDRSTHPRKGSEEEARDIFFSMSFLRSDGENLQI